MAHETIRGMQRTSVNFYSDSYYYQMCEEELDRVAHETTYQHQLIKAAQQIGGFGQKLSNAFLVGVPDLLVKIPGWNAMIIEVKRQAITAGTKIINVELTPTQTANLKKWRKAEGACGWLMVTHMKNGEKWVGASQDLEHLKWGIDEFKEMSCHMRRNDPWLIALQYALRRLALPISSSGPHS